MPFSTVFATSLPNMEEDWNDGENEVESNLIFPDIKDDGGITLTKMWDMEAERVDNFLRTYDGSGKTLTWSNKPSGAQAFYISGTLYHSVTGDTIFDYLIRAGLATIESSSGMPYPAHCAYVDRGVHFTKRICEVDDLSSVKTYYGLIENYFTSGYVYGSIAFYYSVT